ncbi:NADH:flavin oxidoreductase/NADH oxidase family protein [Gammaproteobacteria bacterium]|nr:NADH:flavin oxidoreductase/NADH oxidase family protein [Gammaproteobacteria bacterium]
MPSFINKSFTLPRGQVIKNRICKAAMTERIAKGNNLAHQGHVNLYERWADGDIGILLTGNVQIDRRNIEGPANVVIDSENYKEQLDSLRAWSRAGTKNNTQLWMQISHAGRQTPGEINSSPFAPSNIGLKIPGKNYGTPIPMTDEDILDVIDRFVFTAKIARETGFTGVQFHSAHGYLLSEFLSPDINNRTDAWGGSVENRARIHLEIINKCRKEVGEDFPISVKLNSADFQKGGFSPDESIQVAQMLENAGVDILEISGGTYEQPKLIGVDDLTINPKRSEQRKESTIAREAYFLEYAKDITKAVSLPLMVTGGFRTREGIEDALQSNVCQIVGIGRPLCADPYCVKKMIAGELEVLPSFEKTLSLGPSILSPSSPFTIIKVINAFGGMAWFYQQIKNMAKGLMPNHKQKLFNAFRADMKADKLAIKDYLDNN